MPEFYTFYVGCLFLAALLGFGLAVYALKYPEPVTATRQFAILMCLAGWWALCSGISSIGPSAAWALFWGVPMRYIGILYISPALLIFSLVSTGQKQWLSYRYLALFLLIPTVGLLLIFTYKSHSFFIHDIVYEQFDGIWLRAGSSRGPWFGVHISYSYLVLVVSLIVLALYARHARYPYRQQAQLTLFGVIPPIAISILTTFDLLPGPDLDLIALGFVAMGFAFAFAMFSYRMLDIVPVTRSSIVENMQDFVLVLDNKNQIVDVNGRVQQFLGYGRRQIIGRPAAEVFASWVPTYTEYADAQNAHSVVTIPIKGELAYFNLSITPLKPKNELEGRLIVLHDVTHVKATEAELQTALRNTEALYTVTKSVSDLFRLPDILQTIVDTIALALPANRVALIGFDLEQQIVTHFVKGGKGVAHVIDIAYDELMEGLSGWVLKEVKPALSLKSEPDPRESEQVRQRRIDSFCGAIIVVPLVYREQILGTITAINRLDEPDFTQNDVELMVAMANQAAVAIENARLYEAEHQRVMELQESNEALNAFARTVAHDLKNPLGLIVGYADLISGRGRNDLNPEDFKTETLKDLDIITNQGLKMSSIIDSLLMLASLRKKQDIPITAVNMTQVVEDVLMRLSWQIKENRAEIILPEMWPIVLGFEPWIEEIWANYISNAIKYGGQPPRIQLGAEEVEDGYCFYVRDNGAGLTTAQQAQLFKEFSRLVKHHQTEGHGLGLSIVEYIARRLEGRVGIESEPGAGSKFYFVLPAAPVSKENAEYLTQTNSL